MYVCVCISQTCLCLVPAEVIGLPGTGVWMVVSYHVDAGNKTWVLWRSNKHFLKAEPSLQSLKQNCPPQLQLSIGKHMLVVKMPSPPGPWLQEC